MKTGFFGLLGILFIGLKLTEVIDWEWWLILLPLYGPFSLAMLVIAVWSVGEGFGAVHKEIKKRKKEK